MQHMNRRSMFKLAGAGSAMVAGAALPVVGRLATEQANRFGFKATLGLPEPPLPSYATHLVEGTVDLRTGVGIVTTRVLAGHPGGASGVGLPGLARIIRIDRVEAERGGYRLSGVVEDRSQLHRGESAEVEIVVDRKKGVVHAPFAGRQVTLPLA